MFKQKLSTMTKKFPIKTHSYNPHKQACQLRYAQIKLGYI